MYRSHVDNMLDAIGENAVVLNKPGSGECYQYFKVF